MNKAESKYYNTALKMHKALFEILEYKSFSLINVKELCEKAEVNRSTFYSHYESINDLLIEAKEYLMKSFLDSFNKDVLLMDLPLDVSEDYIKNNFIMPYLKFVKEYKLPFKVFVENLKVFNADAYYSSLLNKVLKPSLKRKGVKDDLTVSYLSRFYLTGITSMIIEWINRECKDDVEYIAEVIMKCNKHTIF